MLKRITFFLFFFLFAFVKQVYADDPRISITHSPQPVKLDSSEVTFTVTNNEGLFDTNHDYRYAMFYPDRINYCVIAPETVTPKDANTIEAKIQFIGCNIEVPGERKFQLWYSGGITNQSGLIVSNYLFVIEQAGGGNPQIIPIKTRLGLSENPQVSLVNARKDNKYEFWWYGSKTEWAAKYTAPNDGNFTIDLAKNGVDFNKDGRKKLCMGIGNNLIPVGILCRYSTEFEFTIIPPPPATGNPSCSIQPSNPVENDSVSIKAVNLPNNQEFQAELVSGGKVIPIPKPENSGSSDIVTIQLADHLGIGSYTGIVRNSTKQEVCKKEFTVGPKDTGVTPVPNKCDPKSPSYDKDKAAKECTLAGGIPCDTTDPKNPGFQTAIGCIHTSPAGFIKDFLKFIIGISGGLAFLMMLLGAFQMLTSAGNPETLQAGRERLTSAIIGLLFVIFAVLLLQIIGFDILKIPGFGR